MAGSKSIWTPANIVTCVRVVLVPVWLAMAEFLGIGNNDWTLGGTLSVFVCFVALSLTDKLDGYLARSRNEVTTFGKFLDPIADKLAVVVALCYLLEIGLINSWVLLVVIAREFLVSGMRMVVATKGVVVAASNLGKWKTATTMVAICLLLFHCVMPDAYFFYFVGEVLMAVAVVLTAWSGIDYFVKCWPALTEED